MEAHKEEAGLHVPCFFRFLTFLLKHGTSQMDKGVLRQAVVVCAADRQTCQLWIDRGRDLCYNKMKIQNVRRVMWPLCGSWEEHI